MDRSSPIQGQTWQRRQQLCKSLGVHPSSDVTPCNVGHPQKPGDVRGQK